MTDCGYARLRDNGRQGAEPQPFEPVTKLLDLFARYAGAFPEQTRYNGRTRFPSTASPKEDYMDRRAFLATTALSAAGVMAPRMTRAAASKTYVLVHGAWHGGWCWTDT
jgi:hypothetical protein